MTINLELPPELEANLTAQAQARGLSLDAFLQDYLIQHAPPAAPFEMTVEEWEKAFDAWLDSLPELPTLSDEAISRQSIYTREDEW